MVESYWDWLPLELVLKIKAMLPRCPEGRALTAGGTGVTELPRTMTGLELRTDETTMNARHITDQRDLRSL